MPVLICPRCKHINPEYATYCHFDGVVLQAQQSVVAHRLPSDFVFPSGRRCGTFDELAQGCQEEWAPARDLLHRGVFAQFFRSCKRDDLVRAANDARANPNPDIALTTFLSSLPGTRTQTPKLDLSPRRILLGAILMSETKTIPLTITNQGQSMLQGTVTVTEGQDWLSLSETASVHEVEVAAVREQIVKLTIRPRGLAAGQTYGAKLTVVTNGGVVEVPLRMELAVQPFPKAPFQGVRTGRELAEKMRLQPKVAVALLESGEIQRWYVQNGWTYPVSGTPVKGIASLQQFFEGMGVSKPPPLTLAPSEYRAACRYREPVRGQVTLQTPSKKWVYATIKSDSPWLKVVEPTIAGPQRASVMFEIDTDNWTLGPTAEGRLSLEGNGGQKLTLRVHAEVAGAPAAAKAKTVPTPPAPPRPVPTPPVPPPTPARPPEPAAPRTMPTSGGVKFIPALITTLVLCLTVRIALVPLSDCFARHHVAVNVAHKLGVETKSDSPIHDVGGWLRLPWITILAGGSGRLSTQVFVASSENSLDMTQFRHYFIAYFIRWIVLGTFWIGSFIGVLVVLRRGGGALDVPWGFIAGTIGGLVAGATLGAFFLLGEMLPHVVFQLIDGTRSGFGYLIAWILLAIIAWLVIGVGLGLILPWIPPLRRLLIDPCQSLLAGGFRLLGQHSLADYWRPS